MGRLRDRLLQPLVERWLATSPGRRWELHVLVGLVAAWLVHYLLFASWFIEDAAISFAFARNFMEGEGLVAFPGGEPVEGFSNPLWTLLMAGAWGLGLPPWATAKVLGALFGALCLPLSWSLARACRPADDHLALLAPLLLAASTVFTAWCGSGLENPLFACLLSLGLLRVLQEADRPGAFPWSAVCLLGVALTRPEGLLYAALGGSVRLGLAARRRRVVGPILLWLLVFFVPFCAWHAWRYHTFAWELPNTYYAKLGTEPFEPWNFNGGGWRYVREYLRAYFLAPALPLFAVALTGLTRGYRAVLVVVLLGTLAVLVTPRADVLPAPILALLGDVDLDAVKVATVLVAGGALTGITLLQPGGTARLLMVAATGAGVLFALKANGDWMAQWRWFSLVAVPGAVWLATGLARLADAIPRGEWEVGPFLVDARTTVLGFTVTGLLLPNVWNTLTSAPQPETTPTQIHRRVVYMQRVADRLHVDLLSALEIDMGAHMWHTDWRFLDIAGLVDVPMAHHAFEKPFLEEYIFEEHRPTFAHVHAGWANRSRIPSLAPWRRQYIELPPYPAGPQQVHPGNHVRKDLLVFNTYEGPPDRQVALDGDVTLTGWDLPAPVVGVGGRLLVDLWLQSRPRREGLRCLALFLQDGVGVHAVELPLGYDWYGPEKWRRTEHIRTRVDLRVPEALGEGPTRLGFLFIDGGTGLVVAPVDAFAGPEGAPMGSYWPDATFQVVSPAAARATAEARWDDALHQFADGRCDAAWESVRRSRWHLQGDVAWREAITPRARTAMARCLAAQADDGPEPERVELLARARLYDHRPPEVTAPATALALLLVDRGHSAASEDRWDDAYAAWRDALRLDPSKAHVRRLAEQARDRRLGLDGKGDGDDLLSRLVAVLRGEGAPSAVEPPADPLPPPVQPE